MSLLGKARIQRLARVLREVEQNRGYEKKCRAVSSIFFGENAIPGC
jgi:hypothetical protein